MVCRPDRGHLSPAPPDGRRRVDLLAIAEGFAVSAPAIPELQELTERTWVLLAVTDLFEAWAIGWPPGGTIELHDHGHSRGAVVVADGALVETTVRPTDRGVALIGTHHIGTGEHRRFGPRYVHDLRNDGEERGGQRPRLRAPADRPCPTTSWTGGVGSTVVRTEEVPAPRSLRHHQRSRPFMSPSADDLVAEARRHIEPGPARGPRRRGRGRRA